MTGQATAWGTEAQQRAMRHISEYFAAEPGVLALLFSGSIVHGLGSPGSDVDLNIVITDELYEEKHKAGALTYWASGEQFYPGGYFDGKFITLDYLRLVAERGNEPTRFALHDAAIDFDRTGEVGALLQRIGTYPEDASGERSLRFLSQLQAWRWYCGEALRKGNRYLLQTAVTKMLLFGGRLILLENRTFFPYHKWLLAVLEKAQEKPPQLLLLMERVLEEPTEQHIEEYFQAVLQFRDWARGREYSWSSLFVGDIETRWMNSEEFIENL